jgi:hypothetical protein
MSFEPFSNTNYLSANSSFNDYLSLIKPWEYDFKTSNLFPTSLKTPIDFRRKYLDSFLLWTNEEKVVIQKYINHILTFADFNSFKTPWNIYKSKNYLENGMPFTIGDYIVIPEKFIKNGIEYYRRTNKFSPELIETLIHEKLHVIQRNNQDRFNDYYLKTWRFMGKGKVSDLVYPYYLMNPDGLDLDWIYRDTNGITYSPILYVNGDRLDSKLYNIMNKGYETLDMTNLREILNQIHGWYHPNEIFAYLVSEKIINSTPLGIEINNILNN